MVIFLTVWGIVGVLFAFSVLGAARSAIYEILAGMGFLIATVAFGCAAIVWQLKEGQRQAAEDKEPVSPPVHLAPEWEIPGDRPR